MRAATRDFAAALSRLALLAKKQGASPSSSSMAIPLRGGFSGSRRAMVHASAWLEAGENSLSPRKDKSDMLKELVRDLAVKAWTWRKLFSFFLSSFDQVHLLSTLFFSTLFSFSHCLSLLVLYSSSLPLSP